MKTFDIEKSIGFLVAKVYQRGLALFKEEFDRFDLTPQQFSLLAFLWKEDRLSQAELSARTQIDRTTIGGLVDRLEKDGLLTRISDPTDRRAYQICLTSRGKELEETLSPVAAAVHGRLVSCLAAEELDTLFALLQKIRENAGTHP